jgi:hypothetical protein
MVAMTHQTMIYTQLFSRSHDAVIRVYDAAGNVIERTSRRGDRKES